MDAFIAEKLKNKERDGNIYKNNSHIHAGNYIPTDVNNIGKNVVCINNISILFTCLCKGNCCILSIIQTFPDMFPHRHFTITSFDIGNVRLLKSLDFSAAFYRRKNNWKNWKTTVLLLLECPRHTSRHTSRNLRSYISNWNLLYRQSSLD